MKNVEKNAKLDRKYNDVQDYVFFSQMAMKPAKSQRTR